jgi:TonB family protein
MSTRFVSTSLSILLGCGFGLSPIGARGQGTLQSGHQQRIQAKALSLGFVLDFDQPPKPFKIVPAKDPRAAQGRHTNDVVVVMLAIDAQGRVADAEILEGIKALNQAALACVKDWRFRPAEKWGRAVGTVMVAPVVFPMTGSESLEQ